MKTFGRIENIRGYRLLDNWYESMAILSAEQELEALHESWGTKNKYRGEECPRCRGRGYTRSDGRVGCIKCGGTGVLEPAHA